MKLTFMYIAGQPFSNRKDFAIGRIEPMAAQKKNLLGYCTTPS